MFSLSSASDSVPRDTDYLVTQINFFLLPQHEADREDVIRQLPRMRDQYFRACLTQGSDITRDILESTIKKMIS